MYVYLISHWKIVLHIHTYIILYILRELCIFVLNVILVVCVCIKQNFVTAYVQLHMYIIKETVFFEIQVL